MISLRNLTQTCGGTTAVDDLGVHTRPHSDRGVDPPLLSAICALDVLVALFVGTGLLVGLSHRVPQCHGEPRAVVLTRLVPGARTVVNPLAAATGVSAGRFAASQVVGAVVWTTGLVFAGELLGTTVPSGEDHVVVIAVLVVLSAVPGVLENRRVRVAAAEPERGLTR